MKHHNNPIERDNALVQPLNRRRALLTLGAAGAAGIALTPGIESPTVSPLHRDGWVAVRSMVPRAQAQNVMDDLYGVGARGILVTDILACRI